MEQVIELINNLRNSSVIKTINQRMKEFESFKNKSNNEIFKELCFCLLTANFNAFGGIKIQKEINDGFLTLEESELSKRLSGFGHRFPNARAGFIIKARKHKNIKQILNSFSDETLMREWLVKNIKGLGMKEASHFLRNIGYRNVAIIDFHILDILVKNNLIEKPKTITPKKYLEIESVLKDLANKLNMSLGELDLYLWYLETGKVLK